MERDLTRGGVVRSVLLFGLPLAFGMASHASFNLLDLWIVGELGEDAVAAVHLGSTINFFPMIVGNGVSVGAVAIVSRLLAAESGDEARNTANLAGIIMVVTALVLGGLSAIFADPLIDLQAGQGTSGVVGAGYLEIVSWGTISMFGLMHVTGLMRAMGNSIWPLVLMLGSNALNIALDFVLIFGWRRFGIEPMGAVGAAWATVLARAIFAVLGLWVLGRARSPLPPGLSMPQNCARRCREIARLGIPQSVQMFVRASLIVTMTRFAGLVGGSAAQAALSVATRLDSVVLFSAVGWAGAATAMCGQSSARDLDARCHRVAWVAAMCAAGVGTVLGFGFFLFSDPLYLLFVPGGSTEYLDHGRLYFAILAFAHPAASASLVLAGAFNGIGVSVRPMLFDLVVFGLLLQPFLFLWLGLGAAGGLASCWVAVLLANWLLLLVYARVMRTPRWAHSG